MKFKLLRTLDESLLLETVIRLDDCYATSSKTDLKTLLTKDRFSKRIVYCDDEWLWLVGNAISCYHPFMVRDAHNRNLTNCTEDSADYGRFYYIPYFYNNDEDLAFFLLDEYPAVTDCIIYDTFIIGMEAGATEGLEKLKSIFNEPIIKEYSFQDE